MELLQSLPIPIGQWTSISIDFITHLLQTLRNFDVITVFVNEFTKRAHFIPSRMTDDAEDFAHLFLKEIVQHHGLPSEVISDQDTRFISKFWTAITDML